MWRHEQNPSSSGSRWWSSTAHRLDGDFSGVRRFAERDHTNLVQWNMHPEPGGHYAAHLEPEVLADDIRGFYRGYR
jgi:hypothetical protein